MIPGRIIAPAEEEIADAALFYESASTGLGLDFLGEVAQVIDRLRKFPEISPIFMDDFRSARLPRFPFNLIYSIELHEILIVAVSHQSRRPGYWRDRIGE